MELIVPATVDDDASGIVNKVTHSGNREITVSWHNGGAFIVAMSEPTEDKKGVRLEIREHLLIVNAWEYAEGDRQRIMASPLSLDITDTSEIDDGPLKAYAVQVLKTVNSMANTPPPPPPTTEVTGLI